MGHALLQTETHIKDDFFLLHAYHFEVDQFIPDMLKKKKHTEDVVLLGKNLGGTDRYGYMWQMAIDHRDCWEAKRNYRQFATLNRYLFVE